MTTPLGRIKKGSFEPLQQRSGAVKGIWTFELIVRPHQAKVFLRKMDVGWVLGVREQAREGLANRGVLKALSSFLDVPISSLAIIRGEGSRIKRLEVVGLSPEEGLRRLEEAHGKNERG